MAEKIARTGRVQSWIDDPAGRLPVSCTTYIVSDSMEGEDGIEASWRYESHGLRNGAGVAVHLSNLRAKGTENEHGLVASGPVSFARIYSVSMRFTDGVGDTRTVLACATSITGTLTQLNSSKLPVLSCHG